MVTSRALESYRRLSPTHSRSICALVLVLAGTTAFALFAGSTAASAEPATVDRDREYDEYSLPDAELCGSTGTIFITSTSTTSERHQDGDLLQVRVVFKNTFDFVSDDPTQPSYSGRFTLVRVLNFNKSDTFTGRNVFNGTLHGSNGTTLRAQFISVTVISNGEVRRTIERVYSEECPAA
jgi:hypothetical protein